MRHIQFQMFTPALSTSPERMTPMCKFLGSVKNAQVESGDHYYSKIEPSCQRRHCEKQAASAFREQVLFKVGSTSTEERPGFPCAAR